MGNSRGALTRMDSSKKLEISLQAEKEEFSNKMSSMKSNIDDHFQSLNLASNTQRTMKDKICDAVLNTTNFNKCIELVSYPLGRIDIECYLKLLRWENVEVVKLVKVGLTD